MTLSKKIYFLGIALALSLLFFPKPSLAGSCKCDKTLLKETGTTNLIGQCVSGRNFSSPEQCHALNNTSEALGKTIFSNCSYCNADACSANCEIRSVATGGSCTTDNDCIAPSPCSNVGKSVCRNNQCYNDAAVYTCFENVSAGLGRTIQFNPPKLEIRIPGVDFGDKPLQVGADGYLTVPYLVQYIKAVYKFLVIAGSILAAILIILNGFRISLSAGGEAKGEGIKRVGQAIVGLFILWSSYAILYTINPTLTQLTPIKVKYVQPDIPDYTVDNAVYNTDPNALRTITIPNMKAYSKAELVPIFKNYGYCLDENWQVLQALAQKESALRYDAVENINNKFTGLFQTITRYAQPFTKTYLGDPKQYEDHKPDIIINPLLIDPNINTEVGTGMYIANRKIIEQICGPVTDLTPATFLYFIYVGHQSGSGALRKVLTYMRQTKNIPCDIRYSKDQIQAYYNANPTTRSADSIAKESDDGGRMFVGIVKTAMQGIDKSFDESTTTPGLSWEILQSDAGYSDENYCPLNAQ